MEFVIGSLAMLVVVFVVVMAHYAMTIPIQEEKAEIKKLVEGEYMIVVPPSLKGRIPTIMSQTWDWLEYLGESVLVMVPLRDGFRLKAVEGEGTLSAIVGVVTQVVEGELLIPQPS